MSDQIIFLNVRFWFRCGCQMGAWGIIMSCGEGELTFEGADSNVDGRSFNLNGPISLPLKYFLYCF
jgi:hypothetical protein